jgi:hypothetical protein
MPVSERLVFPHPKVQKLQFPFVDIAVDGYALDQSNQSVDGFVELWAACKAKIGCVVSVHD